MESAAAPSRLPAIDVAKGLAALWVLLIHADALAGTVPMVQLFNRAAPIFVVLMGVNGGLWWRGRGREALGSWYSRRLRRLYVPMWSAVALWWLIALSSPPLRRPALGPRRLVEHLAGYLVGVGTGWFVTLAISVAIGFPLLVFAARRVGAWPLVALGIVSTAVSFAHRFEIIAAFGVFGWFVFPPRLLAELTFGLALAPHAARLGWREGAAAALLCLVYALVPLALGGESPWALGNPGFGASSTTVYLHRLMDLPVTVLVLLGSAGLALVPWLARPLGWLGAESYGMYLGQMLTHNAITMLVGFETVRAALSPMGYATTLLAGALLWVAAGRALARLRARGGGRLALGRTVSRVDGAATASGPRVERGA